MNTTENMAEAPRKTVTVQIGNSDDKLSQREWSDFVGRVHGSIGYFADQIHFSGHSSPNVCWQNAAWVFEIEAVEPPLASHLREELAKIRAEFKQESVAWTEGETSFI